MSYENKTRYEAQVDIELFEWFDNYIRTLGLNQTEFFNNAIRDFLIKEGYDIDYNVRYEGYYEDIDVNLSKKLVEWSKKEILSIIRIVNKDIDIVELSRKSYDDLCSLLVISNVTDTVYSIGDYMVDVERVRLMTNEDIKDVKFVDTKQTVADFELERERRKQEDLKRRKELELYLKYSRYKSTKTLDVAIKQGRVTLEELKSIRNKSIKQKRTELKQLWENEGNIENLNKLSDDMFIEKFIKGVVK